MKREQCRTIRRSRPLRPTGAVCAAGRGGPAAVEPGRRRCCAAAGPWAARSPTCWSAPAWECCGSSIAISSSWATFSGRCSSTKPTRRPRCRRPLPPPKRLRKINSTVAVEPIVADIGPTNIRRLCDGVDLVLDGTDNFETRFLINDAAVKFGLPWVYGGCVGAEGQSMTILPGETACLRCLMPECPQPGSTATCESAGILGPDRRRRSRRSRPPKP